jgi:hypothetical protein
MFEPVRAREAFETFLEMRSQSLESLGVRDGLDAMLDFYAKTRAAGCSLETDGDMLLFQWGTYDWGEGRRFQLGLTRQLIIAGETEDDDNIWQLSLTFAFEPTPQLDSLGNGDRWCGSPDGLFRFDEAIRQSPALFAACRLPAPRVELEYAIVD